jgi:hypothetical protein
VSVLPAAFSLFVSSLSTSGFRAFLASIPVVAAAAVVLMVSSNTLTAVNAAGSARLRSISAIGTEHWITFGRMTNWILFVLVYGLVLFLIRLGFDNYRWADRSRAWIGQQALWIFGYLFVGAMVMTAVPFVFSHVVSSR